MAAGNLCSQACLSTLCGCVERDPRLQIFAELVEIESPSVTLLTLELGKREVLLAVSGDCVKADVESLGFCSFPLSFL